MKLALSILAGLFFWACITLALLIVTIGEPFISFINGFAWSLK